MGPSLEGRLFDPAWLLGRQWQVGEFIGVDAGSPINAELQIASTPFSGYQSGAAQPMPCGQLPLDALAGPEPRGAMMLFESARAGDRLRALLVSYGCSAAGLADLLNKYPLPAPNPGTVDAQRMSNLGLLGGSVPHAAALEPLLREISKTGTVPAWQANQSYSVARTITDGTGNIQAVAVAGISGNTAPPWNSNPGSTTKDGSVMWRYVGPGPNMIAGNDATALLNTANVWIPWLDALTLRGATLDDCAEAGAQFLALLQTHGCSFAGIAAVLGRLPLPTPDQGTADPQGMSYLGLIAGRVLDSAAAESLLRDARATGTVPAILGISANDTPPFLTATREWIQWLESLILRPTAAGEAWVDASLDYQFSIAAAQPNSDPLAFVAAAWDGERVDWYDLDANPAATPPVAAGSRPSLPGVDSANGLLTLAGPPVPLSYPGMPPFRWWQFDEGHVNFAQITSAKDDLARMLVVEFASVYSNDWYLWPLRLAVGSLNVVQALRVTDTFGKTIAIGPAGSPPDKPTAISDWCLFRPTIVGQGTPSALNGLLLLNSLADEQRSAPIEKIVLLRDETAGLGWAIEDTVPSADGRSLDRHTAIVADSTQTPPDTSSNSDSPLIYRLASDVPANWFPLSAIDNSMFKRLVLRIVASDGQLHDTQPFGSILRPGQTVVIRQEEVPREGAELRRNYHLVRGVDGAVLLWSGRAKRAGRGAGSSGLHYDSAV